MNSRLFITSTGTGIGKSFITAALIQQAKAMSRSVAAYKPVISGFDPAWLTGSYPPPNPPPKRGGLAIAPTDNTVSPMENAVFDVENGPKPSPLGGRVGWGVESANGPRMEESDTGLLLQSLGLPPTPENIERVSPFRYAAPLAPSMAARREQRPLDFHALVAHSQKATQGPEDVVLIEGVGGVMVPLNDRRTVLDWIEALGIPVVLVIGTYLGSISHTLTALSALRQRHIPIRALVVNESEDASLAMALTVDELKLWTDVPLIPVQRRADGNWRDVTELRALLQSS